LKVAGHRYEERFDEGVGQTIPLSETHLLPGKEVLII